VGSYTYGSTNGISHVMKPHRMRITHDLVSAYGMLDKMQVLVRSLPVLIAEGR
jgi:histone deacetylase 1/2